MTPSASRSCKRLFTRLFCALLALSLLGIVSLDRSSTPAAFAQEDKDDKSSDDKGSDSSESSSSDQKVSMVGHMLESLGPTFIIILGAISVSLIAIVVLLSMDLRMGAAVPPDFVADFSDLVNKRQFKQAYDLARNDNSFLGRVMTAGMARLQYGLEDARTAAFQMVDTIKANKQQLIAYLATIGTLGPLLGLVGTVYGMIGAFMRLKYMTGKMDPGALAGDISHALVVTLFGVALSVPAIFFHTFFGNRLTRLSMDTGNVADDLLTQMYHNSKKAGGPSAPEVAPAPDGRTAP